MWPRHHAHESFYCIYFKESHQICIFLQSMSRLSKSQNLRFDLNLNGLFAAIYRGCSTICSYSTSSRVAWAGAWPLTCWRPTPPSPPTSGCCARAPTSSCFSLTRFTMTRSESAASSALAGASRFSSLSHITFSSMKLTTTTVGHNLGKRIFFSQYLLSSSLFSTWSFYQV